MRSLSLELGSRDLERITDDGKTMSAVPRSRFRGDVVATDLSELPGVLQTVHDSFTPPLTHGVAIAEERAELGLDLRCCELFAPPPPPRKTLHDVRSAVRNIVVCKHGHGRVLLCPQTQSKFFLRRVCHKLGLIPISAWQRLEEPFEGGFVLSLCRSVHQCLVIFLNQTREVFWQHLKGWVCNVARSKDRFA